MWFKIFLTINCISITIYAIIFDREYIPDENDVTFHLYHSSDLSICDQLFVDDPQSVDLSRFDANLPTKFIIHGWTHGRDVPWVVEMREAMASLNLWNVIVVDWAPLSHSIYEETREHTPIVSNQLAKLLDNLSKYQDVPMSSIHLIGHSMGGQISASAAYKIKYLTDETIGRITGLDPAAPLFEWPEPENLDELLDPSDATFVDIIHTNAGHLGMIRPAGHVDYYPNGGDWQPGCGFWICSHMRAVEFWTASIRNPYLFKAFPYNSWDEYLTEDGNGLNGVPMGIAAGPEIPFGVYYLKTNNEEQDYVFSKTTLFDSRVDKIKINK